MIGCPLSLIDTRQSHDPGTGLSETTSIQMVSSLDTGAGIDAALTGEKAILPFPFRIGVRVFFNKACGR
jgi:hypothetical protein